MTSLLTDACQRGDCEVCDFGDPEWPCVHDCHRVPESPRPIEPAVALAIDLTRRALSAWVVSFVALYVFWSVEEALQTGQEYADPLLPCVALAFYGTAVRFIVDQARWVFILWRDRQRQGRDPYADQLQPGLLRRPWWDPRGWWSR